MDYDALKLGKKNRLIIIFQVENVYSSIYHEIVYSDVGKIITIYIVVLSY